MDHEPLVSGRGGLRVLTVSTMPRLAARLPAGSVLERVRIMEDPTLYADYTGLT